MKTGSFFAGVLWVGLMLSPVCAAGESGAPMLVIPKAQHDFGAVFEGESVKHDFILHNPGAADLRIEKIKTG
jgi:hypothetical protein